MNTGGIAQAHGAKPLISHPDAGTSAGEQGPTPLNFSGKSLSVTGRIRRQSCTETSAQTTISPETKTALE